MAAPAPSSAANAARGRAADLQIQHAMGCGTDQAQHGPAGAGHAGSHSLMEKIRPGEARPIMATYVNKETGQRMQLSLFGGPAVSTHTMLNALNSASAAESGRIYEPQSPYVLLDLTPGVSKREVSSAFGLSGALTWFRNNNEYPTGTITIVDPDHGAETVMHTTGKSSWAEWSDRLGWASDGMAAGAVALTVVTGGTIWVPILFFAAAASARAAGALSLEDHLSAGDVSAPKVALDVLTIAAGYAGVGAAWKAGFGKGAITVGERAYAAIPMAATQLGIAGTAGVLLAVESQAAIAQIMDSPLSHDEKVRALAPILANLAVSGGLLLLGSKHNPGAPHSHAPTGPA